MKTEVEWFDTCGSEPPDGIDVLGLWWGDLMDVAYMACGSWWKRSGRKINASPDYWAYLPEPPITFGQKEDPITFGQKEDV